MRRLLVKLKRGGVTRFVEDAPTTALDRFRFYYYLLFLGKIGAGGGDLHRKYFLLPPHPLHPPSWRTITNARGRRRNSNNSRVYPSKTFNCCHRRKFIEGVSRNILDVRINWILSNLRNLIAFRSLLKKRFANDVKLGNSGAPVRFWSILIPLCVRERIVMVRVWSRTFAKKKQVVAKKGDRVSSLSLLSQHYSRKGNALSRFSKFGYCGCTPTHPILFVFAGIIN